MLVPNAIKKKKTLWNILMLWFNGEKLIVKVGTQMLWVKQVVCVDSTVKICLIIFNGTCKKQQCKFQEDSHIQSKQKQIYTWYFGRLSRPLSF